MKVFCPRCNATIDLGYLEDKGDQMSFCPNCKLVIAATYKKDGVRRYWEVTFETSLPVKKKVEDNGPGFLTAILILVILGILIAMSQCDQAVPIPNSSRFAGEAVAELNYGNSQANNQRTGSGGAERRAAD